MYFLKTLFIIDMNVVGALVIPNGIVVNLEWPYLVLKVVLWVYSSFILTC